MTRSIRQGLWLKVLTTAFAICASSSSIADEPGPGLTANFEKDYLRMIIDHHYSALRITELAAGTDLQRDDDISPTEGTSPTPRTRPVQAKAGSEEIKSMARRNNRMQREEILTAQGFLRDWYGITYWPHLTPEGQALIQQLEQSPSGSGFDHRFLEVFSRHHYMALGPSTDCQVAAFHEHHELIRYCSNIVHSQISDIQEMREMLAKQFGIHDYQPLSGERGHHSAP